MPLRHRDDAFVPDSAGVTFVMSEAGVGDVVCVVETGALRAAAEICGLSGKDAGVVFRKLRAAIEACASDVYDRNNAAGQPVLVRERDLLADVPLD